MFRAIASPFTRLPGPQTTMEIAAQILLRRWVPKWHEVFDDPGSPLFYERVGNVFNPLLTGQRRLLTQLRQLSMYSHAVCQPENFLFNPDLRDRAHAISAIYAGPMKGSWIFAVDDDDNPLDRTQDLYTHAYVIFAMTQYHIATRDAYAHEQALAAAHYINTAFRRGVDKGFIEALDAQGNPDTAKPRRHESHMHLLEACLAAAARWKDPIFMQLSDELVQLFIAHFYDAENSYLSEYFTNDLQRIPDATSGKIVCEPGHYYEWIWLLKKYAAANGDPKRNDPVCLSLLAWASTHGWDSQHGGIYDEVEVNGAVISNKKRIWPLTEGLKAGALMMDIAPDRDALKAHMVEMAHLLETAYIQKRGFWSEWLNPDLSPVVDYMPATTPYHVYFGIMEAREALRWRGSSKSWRVAPRRAVYAGRRIASALARQVRMKFL